MICPFCRHDDSRVVDSRPVEEGTQIRRRRECPECGQRFSTQEVALLNIIKRSGATEPFSREKVLVGVRKACQGRPVNEDDLVLLAQRVEEALRATGQRSPRESDHPLRACRRVGRWPSARSSRRPMPALEGWWPATNRGRSRHLVQRDVGQVRRACRCST